MNARILSIAAAAIAMASLGATAPANATPLGAAGQALTAQADSLVVEAGGKRHKRHGKWKGHKRHGKWKGKHFKFHFGSYYPSHYPYWCWKTKLIPTKYGYVEKRVFVCY